MVTKIYKNILDKRLTYFEQNPIGEISEKLFNNIQEVTILVFNNITSLTRVFL